MQDFTDPQLQTGMTTGQLISSRELFEKSAGEAPACILDVRGPAEYAAGHIQGAVNIPLGQLLKRLEQIPRDRPVVAYCNMQHRGESRGERAAEQLRKEGYEAMTLDGGYPGWKAQGLPVEEKA